jgi:hypothetical protein
LPVTTKGFKPQELKQARTWVTGKINYGLLTAGFMEEVKNIQFTVLIKAGGLLREFNFRKSAGQIGSLFTIDVADIRGERHYLMFRQENDEWILKTTEVPDWIKEVLPKIKERIQQF